MSIHDARPGPEWYWIYDKNREKWIDRRKYTFDKATNTFVADYSYRLKWIQWLLLLLITAAIIVGIIFGVKSANSKDDNNGGIKIIPASAYDNVSEDFNIDYPDGNVTMTGYGVAQITPKQDFFNPIPNVTGLSNGQTYKFTIIAKDGYQFEGGLKEKEITVITNTNEFHPPIDKIMNVFPLAITTKSGSGSYDPTNSDNRPGLFHPPGTGGTTVWEMHLPNGGWKWNSCTASQPATGWLPVQGGTDTDKFVTKNLDGSPLKIVNCSGTPSQSQKFVDVDAGYKVVTSSNPIMHKPIAFLQVPPVPDIGDQKSAFESMGLTSEEAIMGDKVIQSVEELSNKGLIDRSQLAWVYVGLSGLKTESYNLNGVDINDPIISPRLKNNIDNIELNTLTERIPDASWGAGAKPDKNVCTSPQLTHTSQYWINESQEQGVPVTDYRTLFSTDKHWTWSNLNTLKVFQDSTSSPGDGKYHWAKLVVSDPIGTTSKEGNYLFTSSNSVEKYYRWNGGAYAELTPTNSAQNFWLCQIETRPNSVIIPAWWPAQYATSGNYGFKVDKYIDYILQNPINDATDIIDAVNSISTDSGAVYFPHVSENWEGNGVGKDAATLKADSIASLIKWLSSSILLTSHTVPNYQEFSDYTPNKQEQYWTQSMKDAFDEVNSASLAVVSSLPVGSRAIGPAIKSANVTAAEFDKIWEPFSKLWFNLVHPEPNGARLFTPASLKDLVYDGVLNSGSGGHPYYWGLNSSNIDQLGPIGRINALLDALLSQDAKKIDRFGTGITFDNGGSIKSTGLFGADGFIDLKSSSAIDLGLIQIKFEKNIVDFSSNSPYSGLVNSEWTNPTGATTPAEVTRAFNFINSMGSKTKSELIYYLPWDIGASPYYPVGFLQYLAKSAVQIDDAQGHPQNTYRALLGNHGLKDQPYSEFEKYDVVSFVNTMLLAILHNNWTPTNPGEKLYDNVLIRKTSSLDNAYVPIDSFDTFVERILAFADGDVKNPMVIGNQGDLNQHGTMPTPYTEWPAPLGTGTPWSCSTVGTKTTCQSIT